MDTNMVAWVIDTRALEVIFNVMGYINLRFTYLRCINKLG